MIHTKSTSKQAEEGGTSMEEQKMAKTLET